MAWDKGLISFFGLWLSNDLAPFVEKSIECSWYSCKMNQLTITKWACFWTLSSTPFTYMSILMPVLQGLDYCHFIESFKIRSVNLLVVLDILDLQNSL